jgi:leucyl-tRNA synthetase
MHNYDHQKIEEKWQKIWQESKTFETKDSESNSENKYILVEFPYPSGNLHVGHWYAFAVTDIFAKYNKMLGYNVLFPVGFDAFGLPAENAAIKRNLNPREWTYSNIEFMEKQLKSMGASFDWSRKISTCDPEYYKWTQWLFIKFFEKGLAYQKESEVNWCPSCKTVLANEQVISGHCERCESEVVQKKMNQWFFKITEYADRLIDDLNELNWAEEIKTAQKNWIGRSEGSLIPFTIKDENIYFEVFTTRADTLFGTSYIVMAPEHELVQKLMSKIENQKEVLEYIEKTSKRTEMERITDNKEKTGIILKNIFAINPANNEEIPVFISDYVLANYGTGIVMAVPAHDQRDFEFSLKFNLTIRQVISGQEISDKANEQENTLINSEQFNGLDSHTARQKITEFVGGKLTKNYRLRDWLISRQRYWGCPIPIIHCSKCGPISEKVENLPVELPEITDYLPREDGKSPLAKAENWMNVECPKCGSASYRETDTLDTFIDSSWYYLRYLDSNNTEIFAEAEKIKKWMPVNFYSGGSEHTTMHLLFSRFFYKVMFDLGLVFEKEPFIKRLNRGLILGPDGQKMSKSKGNVIDPDELVERVGSDTVRMYLAFIGPYNETGSYPWDPNGVVGIRRFLEKIIKISENLSDIESDLIVKKELNKTIKKVSEDLEKLKTNTAISAMMIFVNLLSQNKISKSDFSFFLRILFPFAPHLASELFERNNNSEKLCDVLWPEIDPSMLQEESVKIAIQINGKFRDIIEVPIETSEEDIKSQVLINSKVTKWIKGFEIKKIIFIQGKVINIVIG